MLTVEPSAMPAPRVSMSRKPCGAKDGINLYENTIGEALNLPSPAPGVLYVVSALVRLACPDRKDFASPGNLLRNSEGVIIGCDGLDVNN